MANEPSLSELGSISVDAEQGSGVPANVINTAATVDTLNKNAQFKATNDLNRYTTFLDQLNNAYKTGLDIASIDVMPGDREELHNKAADIFQKISDDPRNFFSRRGQTDTYKQLTDLKTNATASKNLNLFGEASKEFIEKNPTYNTPENKAKIQKFWDTPLEQRKPFLLDTPVSFDLSKFGSGIQDLLAKRNTFATSQTEGENGGKGNQYIRSIVGNKIDHNHFMATWNNGLNFQTDENGQPIRKGAEALYNQLPKQSKEEYEKIGGVDAFFNDLGEHYFSTLGTPDKDGVVTNLTKNDLKANPQYEEDKKLALDWAKLGIDKDKAQAQIALWHSKTAGTVSAKRDALDFATTIYNQIASTGKKDADGGGTVILTPDNIRKLTAEQLKYLGAYQDVTIPDPSDDTKKVTTKGLQPLKLNSNDVLELQDGKISVLRNASYDNKTGKWVGRRDNTGTTTISNIATNRINDENQLSGGNEVNGYIGIDDPTGENSNQQSSSSSSESSGETKSDVPEFSTSDLTEVGWTPTQIQQATSAGKIKITD